MFCGGQQCFCWDKKFVWGKKFVGGKQCFFWVRKEVHWSLNTFYWPTAEAHVPHRSSQIPPEELERTACSTLKFL